MRTALSTKPSKFLPEETEKSLIYELGNGQWDIPELRTLLEDVVPKSSVFNDFELEHTFPHIGRRVMLLNARKLKAGNHGELLVLAMEDVTERRRAEANLKAIETFSQNIVDTVREPLLMLDTTLRVSRRTAPSIKPFMCRWRRRRTGSSTSWEMASGIFPALRTLSRRHRPEELRLQTTSNWSTTSPSSAAASCCSMRASSKAGNHGELLVLAMEDVTERRRAEEEVAKAKETAEAANRTKSLFLANMSHELRTPLNAILGYSEMLQEDAVERDAEFLPDLARSFRRGQTLLSLINDILDLSKIEAGKMELYLETFSVPNLIEEVVDHRPWLRRIPTRLRVEVRRTSVSMHADMTKVRQSLFNLLSNAAKFTKKGDISLEVRETMEDREWICSAWRTPASG